MLFSAGKRPFRRYTVLRQPISYFCLMKSPRPSLVEKAAGKDPYDLFLSGASPLLTLTSPQADTERDLIVFRDSFAGSLIPLLLEGYRTITLVDIRYIASDQLAEHITFRDQDILFCYSSTILNAAGTLR